MRIIGVILLCLTMVTAASAELTITTYEEAKKGDQAWWETVKVHINGLGVGMSWANTFMEDDHNVKLYCQPPALALTTDNHIRIVDDMIERMKNRTSPDDIYLKTAPIGLLLLQGLKHTFPCEEGTK